MAPVALASSSPLSPSAPFKKPAVQSPSVSLSQSSMANSPTRWQPTEVQNPPKRDVFAFDSMEEALAAFGRGEFLVVMDDEGRENEGDLIIAASECTTEKMAWMIKHTSGYICISLPGERLDELEIPMMFPQNQDRHRTAYTVTVDYKYGTTTGISAHDRALTARSLSSPTTLPTDFTRPGHLVPLRARPGYTLARPGHTESAIDLCRLSGTPERAGLLCELVNDNEEGSMMRRDECRRFADRWGLRMVSVEMLMEWRRVIGDFEGVEGVRGNGNGAVNGVNGSSEVVNGVH
ncbi:hypothetical protein JAAARDRAFT_42102 [Jaapia argillacea MUCL 33604]|uniref:3,4-dihydroxy-2-butanone 4-phosphate synthase n=1 Tax=Jaapia argillacea MUCL 33604 TaxID=933084 RepID=A0A067P6F0_9AGAM|nr:hypothetical protein JAAARDRAFT_42102 [Jaapia argillacea MUCL 33604]